MKGDFLRDTFDSKKHYARVLMQQGRVQLDADWNEQQASVLHHLRMLTVDLIGEHWAAGDGFKLQNDSQANDFLIGDGRFYANGILCENESPLTYTNQIGVAKLRGNKAYLAYLDVWERHITSIEDDSIREVALGGADSCTRAKVVWQVKALPLTDHEREKLSGLDEKLSKQLSKLCETLLSKVARSKEPSLAARIDPGQQVEDAQVTPPASKYRGAENQLYRVEIHSGGPADDATFKWSRNNGSIATSWLGSAGNDLKVRNTRGFVAGNWAELTDDNSELLGKPGALVHIVKVEDDVLSIDPAETLPARSKFPVNPKIRRWDQLASDAISLADDNAVPLQVAIGRPTTNLSDWIDLEDGIQVKFSSGSEYRTGDYWLIPARVATGNIEWPQDDKLNPQPLPPRGIDHFHAPLGIVHLNRGKVTQIQDCRCVVKPVSNCVRAPR